MGIKGQVESRKIPDGHLIGYFDGNSNCLGILRGARPGKPAGGREDVVVAENVSRQEEQLISDFPG